MSSVLALPRTHITTLTATCGSDGRPLESADCRPTYRNIVAALHALAVACRPGDHVYIHYSGHGARSPTLVPDVKGVRGLDESLVPMDIGEPDGRYLRDIEIAHLLHAISCRGASATVVLDSCHSGGATRGASLHDTAVRGTATVDRVERLPSALATNDALAHSWSSIAGPASTHHAASPSLLPPSGNYVLLAACRPSERAFEVTFNGSGRHGALTYWLFDSLQRLGPDATCLELKDRVVAMTRATLPQQTPMLLGPGERTLFGRSARALQYVARVTEVNEAARRLRINIGRAHNVRVGARFTVYASAPATILLPESRAKVCVIDVDSVSSLADMSDDSLHHVVASGDIALLTDPGDRTLRRVVSVESALDSTDELSHVRDAVRSDSSGWIALSVPGDHADFRVEAVRAGVWHVLSSTGAPLLVGGTVTGRAGDVAREIARRLTHLAKFSAVRLLASPVSAPPLVRVQVLASSGSRAPFRIAAGDTATLHIENASPVVLNVSVIALQQDWSIQQILPYAAGNSFCPLDPGESVTIAVGGSLPPGLSHGVQVLKIFATTEASDFHILELPSLVAPAVRSAGRATVDDLLDASARTLVENVGAASSRGHWMVVDVELHVSRWGR